MNIEVTGIEAVDTELTRLASLEDFKRGLALGALHIKSVLATYPPERHAPQPFVSARQRRGFFAKLRSGEITVPYARGSSRSSEGLGRRWTTEARNNGLTQVVGNNASYAQRVQGDMQTMYHRVTGWKTAQQVAQDEGARAIEIVRAEVRAGSG